MKPRQPTGLGARGKKLWADLVIDDMPADQASLLVETCRVADRLEDLDRIIRGRGVIDLLRAEIDETDDGLAVVINIDDVLMESRQQQNLYKQLLVTVRQLAPGAQKTASRTTRGAYSKSSKVVDIDEAASASSRSWRGA